MNCLFYSRIKDGAGEGLLKVVKQVFPEEKREIFRKIDSLSNRLRQPRDNNLTISVLLAASREDLLELLSLGDLLRDTRIILILPDREKDTIAKGHTLRPRFLTYADSDFAEVVAVLSKMFENTN